MSVETNRLTDAGKITVLTSVVGVVVFGFVFLLNIGGSHLQTVDAQDYATTTVTVLNTPPQWTGDARELFESSTTTPTDAGQAVYWVATGTDANAESYFLLICMTSATPTAAANAPPTCGGGTGNQWAISATTTSGAQATAATTTADAWAEVNAWFGWICDFNTVTPRCNSAYRQGTSTPAYASPFEVNHRPSFSVYIDDSPRDPGATVTFYSTSSDSDTSGTADTVKLIVCNLNDFSTSTNECGPGGYIASSTVYVSANASTSYTIVIPTQDQDYTAYGFVIDNHGFEASGGAHGTDSTLTVNNVAPTVDASSITLNGGNDLVLTEELGQTTGFTLQYTAHDNNSCVTAASSSEIVGYSLAFYRSGVTDTVCDGSAGAYNANNCYVSGVPTTTWNLSCTASSTSCSGALDTGQVFDCTFPLWYIADPTDGTATSTQYPTEYWMGAIQAVDDDSATGTKSTSTVANSKDVTSFLAFALNTLFIPYGSLEPGSQTDPISATTSISATGNVGLDERLTGESMCVTYGTNNECPNSATSTIAESEQVFATSSVSYASGIALSSTTQQELEVNVFKSTSTSTPATGNTIWGIRVPSAVTLAGDYKGENTFFAVHGEAVDWD